jgi:hypothetical protein
MPDITPWTTWAQQFYVPPKKPAAPAAAPAPGAEATAQNGAAPAGGQPANAAPTTPPATPDQTAATPPADAAGGGAVATNGGWIIEMRGYHLHNSLDWIKDVKWGDEGEEFLKSTIIKNLDLAKIKLPDGPKGESVEYSMADLGIKMPVVVTHEKIRPVTFVAETPENAANVGPGGPMVRPMGPEALAAGGAAGVDQPKQFKLRKYRFVIQFCWQPQPRTQRQEKLAQKKAAEAATASTPAETPRPSS